MVRCNFIKKCLSHKYGCILDKLADVCEDVHSYVCMRVHVYKDTNVNVHVSVCEEIFF